jgi:hypothetical protein
MHRASKAVLERLNMSEPFDQKTDQRNVNARGGDVPKGGVA